MAETQTTTLAPSESETERTLKLIAVDRLRAWFRTRSPASAESTVAAQLGLSQVAAGREGLDLVMRDVHGTLAAWRADSDAKSLDRPYHLAAASIPRPLPGVAGDRPTWARPVGQTATPKYRPASPHSDELFSTLLHAAMGTEAAPTFDCRLTTVCNRLPHFTVGRRCVRAFALRLSLEGRGSKPPFVVLPEAVMDVASLSFVRDRIALRSACPCFRYLFDHGWLTRTALLEPDKEVLPRGGQRTCMSEVDSQHKESPPFGNLARLEKSDLFGIGYANGADFAYRLEERAPSQIGDVMATVAAAAAAQGGGPAGGLFRLIRSILFQVCNALEVAQNCDPEFTVIHGGLTVANVTLKYLAPCRDRAWLFRASHRWMRLAPEDHQGYLVKIGDFSSSSLFGRDMKQSWVSLASDDVHEGYAWSEAYAKNYDIGVFCWSLARLISGDHYRAMANSVGIENVRQLADVLGAYAHVADSAVVAERDPAIAGIVEVSRGLATATTVRAFVAKLRKLGRVAELMERLLWESDDGGGSLPLPAWLASASRRAYVDWMTADFVPFCQQELEASRELGSAPATAPPPAPTAKRRRRQAEPSPPPPLPPTSEPTPHLFEYSKDSLRIFLDYSLDDDPSSPPPQTPASVALSTHLSRSTAAERPCQLCGGETGPGRTFCSATCAEIFAGRIPTVSAVEILATPPQELPAAPSPLPTPAPPAAAATQPSEEELIELFPQLPDIMPSSLGEQEWGGGGGGGDVPPVPQTPSSTNASV